MKAMDEMFNLSFAFLKIMSGKGVKFRKNRNSENRDNGENRNGHMTKICKLILINKKKSLVKVSYLNSEQNLELYLI